MYSIYKITSNVTVDYAAEELKKYLRMMMPRCGEIKTSYNPDAKEGFRLGLMSDFGIDTSEAKDTYLDDIVHIETDKNGGIIAGSNPRSVLFAVYRYLKENGCRWLFPGVDGEYIPITDIKPVKYHKMADLRYRGQCNEGSEAQQNMLDTIEYAPKVGNNLYMLEFDVPYFYYNFWYSHTFNDTKSPEPVDYDTILQWKRVCETEISKRGLEFHDMGHGWNAEPFGINSRHGWDESELDVTVPEENVKYLAQINGKRQLFGNVPLNTNVCLSNPEARKIIVNYVADYAETQNNVDFLHVWLADDCNNHCECEKCVQKRPSDWYLILLNEIDAELTKRNLKTHIAFIAYVDTIWAPLESKLNNPDRFTMLFAPITRTYTETYAKDADKSLLAPYVRNNIEHARGMACNMAYLDEWKKNFSGDCICYEYHFWRHQFYDPGVIKFAKILYEDITSLKKHKINGFIEDGSQRTYFPNGFLMYLYSEVLFDTSIKFEDILEDYFSHAYGKDWKKVVAYFEKLTDAFGYEYLTGHDSLNYDIGKYYNPPHAESIKKVRGIVEEFKPVIEQNIVCPKRANSVSWQLLKFHAEYCELFADAFALKAENKQEEAKKLFKEALLILGKQEDTWQKYYDQGLVAVSLKRIFNVTGIEENVTR